MGITSKLRYGFVVSAAAVIPVTGCAAIGGEPDPEPVVIGVDLELSGSDSTLGEIYLQAMELRVAQINEQELLGDRRLELRPLDNRSDRETSVANLGSLAADSSVSAIITGDCGECVLEASETLQEHGVPTISLAKESTVVQPVDERSHIFKLGPNAADNAALLADTLNRAGHTTIGLVTTDDAYGQEGAGEMVSAAERVGIEVVVTQTVDANPDRLDPAANEVASYQPEPLAQGGLPQQGQVNEAAGPDAVVVWAPAPVTGGFATSLRGAGYEGPLYLDAAAADDVILAGQGSAALVGATMVFTETLVIDDVVATSPAKVARKTWVRDYTAEFGRYDAVSSFAADAVELVAQAVTRFENADSNREVLRAAIEVMQMEGFSGTIQMSPRQHSGLRPQTLTTLVARGDRWRPSV